MYVSLIGRFEAGSTKVVFRLSEKIWPSVVANLDPINYTGSGIKLQIVDFTYCDNPAHINTHFPLPKALPVPALHDHYPDTIQIRIPKPFKLSHRRSTLYFVPNLDLTTNTSDYEDQANEGLFLPEQPRVRRAPPVIADSEVVYHAGFDKEFVMTSFVKPGTTSVVDFLAKLKSYQEIRINSAFGFLNLTDLNFTAERTWATPENVSAAAPDSHAKIEKAKISVTIPPGMHIGFSDSRLWQALGFDLTEFQIQLFKKPDMSIQFFGPSNIASSLPLTITATHWITAKASLNVQLRLLAIQRGTPRLGESFKDNISLGALKKPAKTTGTTILPTDACATDTSYPLSIYRTILKNVTQELMLNPNSLVADENKAEGTITLKKYVAPTSPTLTSQNFKLLIQAGPIAGPLLGLSDRNPCLWFPSEGDWKSDPVFTASTSCTVEPTEDLTYNQNATVSPTPGSPIPGTPPFASTPIPSPDPEKKRKAETTHPAAPPKKYMRVDDTTNSLDQTEAEAPDTASAPASTSDHPTDNTELPANQTDAEAPDTASAPPSTSDHPTDKTGLPANTVTNEETKHSTEVLTEAETKQNQEQERLETTRQLEETKRRQEENLRLLEESNRLKEIRDRELSEQTRLHLEQKKQREDELRQLDEIKKQKEAALEELAKLKNLQDQQIFELQKKKEEELQRLDTLKTQKEKTLQLLEEAEAESKKKRVLEEAQRQEALAKLEEAKRQTETHLQTLLESIKQSQLEHLKLLEETKTIRDENQKRLEEAKLTHLKELQTQKNAEILMLEEKHRQLEKEKNLLLQETKTTLELEKKKILEDAHRQAQIEKQKILDAAKQQALIEEEKKRQATNRELEQQHFFRQQEALRLKELETQLRLEATKLAEETERLRVASDKLATLEQEKINNATEIRLLKEKLQATQDQVTRERLLTDAEKLKTNQQQLLQEEKTLQTKISTTTKQLTAVETTKRFLEEQTTRLQEDLHSSNTQISDNLMDVDQLEEEDDEAPSQTFQTPEASFSEPANQESDSDEQNPPTAWDYIDIPNPSLAPATTFEPTQNQPLGRCPLPLNFPRAFTLILLEGLNRDYCMERGYCSVLGTVRTLDNGGMQIIDNLCILQANEIEQLTLDIVDDHLTSYSPKQTAYIKLDLKLHRLTKLLY